MDAKVNHKVRYIKYLDIENQPCNFLVVVLAALLNIVIFFVHIYVDQEMENSLIIPSFFTLIIRAFDMGNLSNQHYYEWRSISPGIKCLHILNLVLSFVSWVCLMIYLITKITEIPFWMGIGVLSLILVHMIPGMIRVTSYMISYNFKNIRLTNVELSIMGKLGLSYPTPIPTIDSPVMVTVDAIPIQTVDGKDVQRKVSNITNECMICFHKFKSKNDKKFLKCFHYYHEHCIKTWLKNMNRCPECNLENPYLED